jgi:hypothetical protein
VYTDGWCPDFCAYTYFRPGQRGTLQVSLSRTAYNGGTPPAQVTIVVGSVSIDSKNAPVIHPLARVKAVVPNQTEKTVSLAVVRTPVRVEVTIAPSTLIPPRPSDPRTLGVQVAFSFVPAAKTR